MPFSKDLEASLKKSSFPLTSSAGLKLWDELLTALETNLAGTIDDAKGLALGYLKDSDGTWWDKSLTVKGVSFTVGLDDVACFLGAAHAALTKNYTLAVGLGSTIPSLIKRVRKLGIKAGVVKESGVVLQPVEGHHKMGSGLTTTSALTYVPDSSLGSHSYGSTPDQKAIAAVAPAWAKLVQRVYESKGSAVLKLGKKPHYVLAHLINHNINGSGSDAKNVVPFYAAANTSMAQKVEKFLTFLVQRGVPVQYTIVSGPAVGMTDARKTALAACTTSLQREIIEIEQYLPAYLTITLAAKANDGTWVTIVNALQIDNYVPETVPVT